MQFNTHFTQYIVKYCEKIMPKYALIQNISGLTSLLCHLLHSRHFQAISLNTAYIVYHLTLSFLEGNIR
jgi:hypothetical protein